MSVNRAAERNFNNSYSYPTRAGSSLTDGWYTPDMAAGTPYEGMENPYVNGLDFGAVQGYLDGDWQLFDKSGTRNYELYLKALEWNNNMMSSLASWNAEKMIYQQQVEGQQAAGLNPDLNGVSGDSSGVPSPASPSGDSGVAGTAADSGQQTVGFIFNVLSSVMSAVNTASGTIMNIGRIKGQNLMNQGQEILNNLRSSDLVGSGLKNEGLGLLNDLRRYDLAGAGLKNEGLGLLNDLRRLNLQGLGLSNEGLSIANDIRRTQRYGSELDSIVDFFANTLSSGEITDFLDGKTESLALSMDANKFASYTGLSSEQAARLTRGWNQRINSPEVAGVLSRQIADRYKALSDVKDVSSRPGFSFDFNPNELLRKQYSLLREADMMYQSMSVAKSKYDKMYYQALDPVQQAGFQNSKNVFDTSYYKVLNPATSAIAANAEKELNAIRSGFEENVFKIINDIYSNPSATFSDMAFANQLYAQLIQGRGMSLGEFGTSWLGAAIKGGGDLFQNLPGVGDFLDSFNSDMSSSVPEGNMSWQDLFAE